MSNKISIDTNILINDAAILEDTTKDFVISFKVVQELDGLKRNPDLKRAAQSAINAIWKHYEEGNLEILNVPTELGESPDEIIIEHSKQAGASILSDDIGVRIIAKAHGVPVSGFEQKPTYDPNYKGYLRVKADLSYESYIASKTLDKETLEELFHVEFKQNMYLIVERMSGQEDIWFEKEGYLERVSQSAKPLKDAGIMATPLDSEQQVALHSIMNPDVPLVFCDGVYGVGKSLIALMAALATTTGQKRYQHYEKIYVTRPPVSLDKNLYLGFLKGGLEEKLGAYLGGIKSNLKFLVENTAKEKADEKADKVFDEYFELINLDSIQGVSLHNSILLVDEAQLISTDTMKLVLSRIASGSKLVLMGDTKYQEFNVNRSNAGYRRIFEHIGKAKELSYVRLENIYRSELTQFVARVFDDI